MTEYPANVAFNCFADGLAADNAAQLSPQKQWSHKTQLLPNEFYNWKNLLHARSQAFLEFLEMENKREGKYVPDF